MPFHSLLLFFIAIDAGLHANSFSRSLPSGQDGYPFGQLRYSVEQKTQVLPSNQSPLLCAGVRPNIRVAHPIERTRYYMCRDQLNYEIFTCPNGGIYDDPSKTCIDLCEQRKPCLNQGQCIILSNLTLQCVCRRDWTGERCETPVSTCASQPCGPNGDCQMLNANDYPQDYVCTCNKEQSYGRSCQDSKGAVQPLSILTIYRRSSRAQSLPDSYRTVSPVCLQPPSVYQL